MTWTQKQRSAVLFGIGLLVAAGATVEFRRMWIEEPLFPSPALTEVRKLSDYHPRLRGSSADTDVFVFDSGEPGGTLLVLGGAHPNESAGFLGPVTMLENIHVERGRVFIIPRANALGFTHTESQDAMPQRYEIPTPHGPRWFRNGSRLTNPTRQWPDPSIYVTPAGVFWQEQRAKFPADEYPDMRGNPGPYGQTIGGVDSRNLNRTYPGMPRGTLTEQIAFAITTLIREEDVDIAIDYHEAAPEYPTINVIVAHPRAQDISAMAELYLSDDFPIVTDPSSPSLRGLSHREWGDASRAMTFLLETTNVAQSRLRGRTTEAQIVKGYDPTVARAALIEQRLNRRLAARAKRREERGLPPGERRRTILQAPVPPEGVSMEVRVGRHVQTTLQLVESFNMDYPDREIVLSGIPSYRELTTHGLGAYLRGPEGEPPAGPPDAEENEPGSARVRCTDDEHAYSIAKSFR